MAVRLAGVLPPGAVGVSFELLEPDGTGGARSVDPQPTFCSDHALRHPLPPGGTMFVTESDGSSHVGAIDAEGAFVAWAPDPAAGQWYVAITDAPDGSGGRRTSSLIVAWSPELAPSPTWS